MTEMGIRWTLDFVWGGGTGTLKNVLVVGSFSFQGTQQQLVGGASLAFKMLPVD